MLVCSEKRESLRNESSTPSYREGLCGPHLRHVDRDSGATGDHEGRVQKIYLDRDIAGRGAVMLAHLDLYGTFTGKLWLLV